MVCVMSISSGLRCVTALQAVVHGGAPDHLGSLRPGKASQNSSDLLLDLSSRRIPQRADVLLLLSQKLFGALKLRGELLDCSFGAFNP